METIATQIARQIERLKVLVVDDEPSMRKVARALLQSLGIKEIYEAGDGRAGLDKICTRAPDIVLLDWQMPSLDGPEFMRALRSPGTFPLPDVPVIMLTASSERSRVLEAVELGVNEYLLKPVSTTALLARIVSIMVKPRPMVRRGDFYGPEPRELATYKPGPNEDSNQIFLIN
ncbi:MAG: response regulator [Xanthobacteraceae bacterium]|jgi:two-component system, chemotaxis family, chemotaxis protein CheY